MTKKLEMLNIDIMWNDYIHKTSQIKRFILNMKNELGINKEYLSIYQDNIEQKCKSIQKIKAIWNIEKSFDNHTIPREKLKMMTEHFNDNREELHNIWGVKFKKGELSEKAVIGCLHQIFEIWCGSDFF